MSEEMTDGRGESADLTLVPLTRHNDAVPDEPNVQIQAIAPSHTGEVPFF